MRKGINWQMMGHTRPALGQAVAVFLSADWHPAAISPQLLAGWPAFAQASSFSKLVSAVGLNPEVQMDNF